MTILLMDLYWFKSPDNAFITVRAVARRTRNRWRKQVLIDSKNKNRGFPRHMQRPDEIQIMFTKKHVDDFTGVREKRRSWPSFV